MLLPMASSTVGVVLNNSDSSGAFLQNGTTSKNGISTSGDSGQTWSFEFSAILASILSVSAFCTVVGNSMVLMVIIRHRGMRTRTNLFLLNLAVADLLVGLLVMPFSITTLIRNKWIFGETMCLLNGWMNSFCLVSAFHTLMYISIHKYFSIVRPLNNPLKLTYIIVMMAAAWLWAAVCSTLNVTVLKVKYKTGTSQCGPLYPSGAMTYIVHGLLQATVIVAPAVILVFCYVRMFIEIKKHSKRLRANSTVEEDFILSQQKKVTITLFIVLATFVMMALPYHIYATYTTIEKDKKFPPFINPLAYMFLYSSSMCNPIIYAFRSPAFREGYKEILCQTPNYVVSDGPMGTIKVTTQTNKNNRPPYPRSLSRATFSYPRPTGDSSHSTRSSSLIIPESEVTRARRLSSLVSSFRRVSSFRSGNQNVKNCAESRSLNPKPTEAGDRQTKPKFGRQKSLLELLRSTRQSRLQSVVHRNGDIIIIKGGKIVSVRREGSPFLDKFKTLKETNERGNGLAAGLAGPGHVMFGLVYEGGVGDGGEALNVDKDVSESTTVIQREHKQSQEGVAAGNPDEGISCIQENGIAKSHLENKNSNQEEDKGGECFSNNEQKDSEDENGSLSEQSKYSTTSITCEVGKSAFFKDVTKGLSETDVSESTDGDLKSSSLPDYLKSSIESAINCPNSGGVVIHLDDDDDILSVMPLTPNTRECIAKSDMNISQTKPDTELGHSEAFVLTTPQLSQSSERVRARPPAFTRLPSVEFLDPPVHLFRSRSNVFMHKGKSEVPKKRERSHSPDVNFSSKSSFLQSHFSSRIKATHL